MVNRFVLNAVSYHGNGAIKEIPGIVSAKGFKKAFIASDPDLVKFGVTKKVTDLLDEAGMRFNLTPLDAAQLARLFSEKGQEPSDPCKR